MFEIKSFIDKDTFKTFAGCVMFVEACTECCKLLFIDVSGVWIALFFSIFASMVRWVLSDAEDKQEMILAVINIVPIFLGSIGVYEAGIKPIINILGG